MEADLISLFHVDPPKLTGAQYCELAERISDVAPIVVLGEEARIQSAVARFFRDLQSLPHQEAPLESNDLLGLRDEQGRPLLLPEDFEQVSVVPEEVS